MAEETVNELKIGVVGAGIVGQLCHMETFSAVPGCRIVALAELRPELRRRVAERYGIARTYADHDQLLRDPDVEAVVVVTQRPWLGPVTLACLEAGRHVLTEKPMAGTFEQAQRLVGAARRNHVQLVVGYLRLHDDGVQAAKRLLDEVRQSGELGHETFLRMHCFQGEGWNNLSGHLVSDEPLPDGDPGWPTAPDWLPDAQKLDYARYVNVHCHQVSLLRFLTGRTPVVDHARLDHQRGRVAVLDFGDYAGVLETGQMDHRGWDDLVEVYFERGRLRLELPPGMLRNVAARVELLKGDGRQQEVRSIQSDWTWAFQNQARSFVEAVRGGQPSVAGGEGAAEDLRLIESIWQQQLRIQQPVLEVA